MSNLNNYQFAKQLDQFKAKILDPQKIKVEKASAIMKDDTYKWESEDKKKAGQAQYDAYKAWLAVYETHYQEGMKLCAQHEHLVNNLSKHYDQWYNNVSNEGKQETELMSSQADILQNIFVEIWKELKPLDLNLPMPNGLNL